MSSYTRLVNWTRTGTLAAAAQATVQLLGFAAGIVVIRSLAPQQYALYTIMTTALGTLTVLTDSGVNSGVLAQGGAVWHDKHGLGVVVATALQLRRRLALLAIALALPLALALLHHQGAGWVEAAIIAASILPLFLATVTAQLLEVVPRLHQTVWPVQRLQVATNLGRALLVALLTPLWPIAAVACLAAAPPQWWLNWRLRALASVHADWHTASDPAVRHRLLSQVRRTMPGAIYYSVASQLTVWLISLAGRPTSVAAVGALGRLAMLLSVLSSAFAVVAVPRFARIPASEQELIGRRYWQAQLALALLCSVPLLALASFPDQVLRLLGPHYHGLGREALLMGLSGAAALMAGAAFSLGAARGIIAPPQYVIPCCLLGQIALVVLLPIDTVAGVIWIGALSAVTQWLMHVIYFQCTADRRAASRPDALRPDF